MHSKILHVFSLVGLLAVSSNNYTMNRNNGYMDLYNLISNLSEDCKKLDSSLKELKLKPYDSKKVKNSDDILSSEIYNQNGLCQLTCEFKQFWCVISDEMIEFIKNTICEDCSDDVVKSICMFDLINKKLNQCYKIKGQGLFKLDLPMLKDKFLICTFFQNRLSCEELKHYCSQVDGIKSIIMEKNGKPITCLVH